MTTTCYDHKLKVNPNLTGLVEVLMTVDPRGLETETHAEKDTLAWPGRDRDSR